MQGVAAKNCADQVRPVAYAIPEDAGRLWDCYLLAPSGESGVFLSHDEFLRVFARSHDALFGLAQRHAALIASTMAHTVLVIHGAGEPRRRAGKIYWESMLGRDLRPEYIVRAPRMPQPTNPQYQAWARRIAELIADGTSRVLVGHSFGASVLLKYLVDATPRPSFTGLFL